ncbi:hypothetical protein KY289_011780 [Solanum tuberosum]|nr:hypothetical protein KY289_011780 [Solanum tuberosum]
MLENGWYTVDRREFDLEGFGSRELGERLWVDRDLNGWRGNMLSIGRNLVRWILEYERWIGKLGVNMSLICRRWVYGIRVFLLVLSLPSSTLT